MVLQSHYRGWMARRFFVTLKAVVTIQAFFRGWKVRGVYMLSSGGGTLWGFTGFLQGLRGFFRESKGVF